ncbi:MAG TPA: hypothetical protein VIO61_05075 [Anaerolineaceae bacterium]
MPDTQPKLTLDAPAYYQIKVQGKLDLLWRDAFLGMSLRHELQPGDGVISVLEGTLPDQAALFGVINQMRDLGLPLISVQWIHH